MFILVNSHPEAIRRECAKVDFLGGEPEADRPQLGTMPQSRTHRGTRNSSTSSVPTRRTHE